MSAWFRKRGCPSSESLAQVSSGQGGDAAREAVLRHAAVCPDCREALLALALALRPGTPDEEALLARALEAPPAPFLLPAPVPAPVRRVRWSLPAPARRLAWPLLAAATLALAAVVAPRVLDPGAPGLRALEALAQEARPTEGRLSLQLPHAPYRPVRGPEVPAVSIDDALARLRAAGERNRARVAPALAALYVYRGEPGDLARAEAELELAPEGPDRDNDRAVLLLTRGRPEEAVELLQGALAVRPEFGAARFNLAVALEALGRKQEAARALRSYLAGADVSGTEASWVAEARQRLADLEGAGSP